MAPSSTSPVRVRFAPSPTGYLHIGGVRTALFNWLWARKTGGTFVLRIEDTDQERSTDASRQVIFESMKWLGLSWDEGPEVGGSFGPYTQMERLPLYKEHADRLVSQGKAFRCTCTKEELDAQRAALKAKDPKASFIYPGTCREANRSASDKHVVRFKTNTAGSITYTDLVFGEITTPNAAQQDFVLLRSDGVPLYNFGAVVDDVTMKITLVARGRDHMVNTPPQIMLYEALGAAVPQFAHLPMMLSPSGEKLSKRHGAVSVGEYQSAGFSPAGLLNYLIRFGWSFNDEEVFSLPDMIEKFDWARCTKSDGKFDAKKLSAVNHEHLKQARLTSVDEYAKAVRPFLVARGIKIESAADEKKLRAAIAIVRERATTYVLAADALDYFFRETPVFDEKADAKFLVAANADLLDRFAKTCERHSELLAIENDEKELQKVVEGEMSLPIKDFAQPARVALTGRTASPGLFEVIRVLGLKSTIDRLHAGAERARARA